MSLPAINEVRQRIETCQNPAYRMYLKATYLFATRGIELAGKLTASDLQIKKDHEIYGPRGTDVWLDETEPPDIPQKEVAKLLITAISGDKAEALRMVEKFTSNIPVAVFRIRIAKQQLEPGETAPFRLIALPLVAEFEPWAKEVYEYFKAAGNNYVFQFSRQDVWEYITHKQRIFEGLNYRIRKYLYLKSGAVIEKPEDKGMKVLGHNRKFKGHGIRHVRVDELLKKYNFDGLDIAGFVGWSMDSVSSHSAAPHQTGTYADVREMWTRYVKKLCKPNTYIPSKSQEDTLTPEEITDVEASEKEIREGKCKTFNSAKEMIADLHKSRSQEPINEADLDNGEK